ncbi:MAG: hypothetical protein IH862_00570 [Chloroflexi bacterium]|nr:hypothetical protein [Chloroflexota bacterium]
MRRRPAKVLKWAVLGLALLTLSAFGRDSLGLNPAEEAAAAYRHDLVAWHLANFPRKWIHRLVTALPWNSRSEMDKRLQIEEFFRVAEDASRISSEIEGVVAGTTRDAATDVGKLEAELEQLTARRNELRNDVEETLEAVISAVIVEEGFASWGEFMFPPVDVRLTDLPKLLVTSPRDAIIRTHEVLLDSRIKVSERDEVEAKLLDKVDLAALVLNIGGVATYPASVPRARPLRWTLQTSAHEWLHHYFFFKPLGQNLHASRNMRILNETMADIAGREIGDRAFQRLGGTIDQSPPTNVEASPEMDHTLEEAGGFEFRVEMRKTRLRVDELLAEGRIEEAEAYMEQRRILFVENGFFIRKLNQAFFAFNGTYAESAASISPIGDELQEYNTLVPDLGDFITGIAGVSDYGQFIRELEQIKARPGDS